MGPFSILLEFLQLLEEEADSLRGLLTEPEGSMGGVALVEASRLFVRKSTLQVWDEILSWTASQLE
jgi:hypothetical protein